jgi:hypothetical protein
VPTMISTIMTGTAGVAAVVAQKLAAAAEGRQVPASPTWRRSRPALPTTCGYRRACAAAGRASPPSS